MYIVFEGIDGAGKSTQIQHLKEWLVESGFKAEIVVEPTNSDVGKLIRKILRNPNATNENTQKTLGLLFAADRMLLMDEIEKKENEKIAIISDRSFYSSLAYQKPFEWIKEINKYVKKPDIVLLLDLDEKSALSRIEGEDTFENDEFLKNVRKNYLKMGEKSNFKIINANTGENRVKLEIKRVIAPYFEICVSGISE
ncbi:MAG: dTMP kinase [Methanobrevibacter sp.]|jgi:dTMP kinase|nr:dTMP kinase [Methanobrevibacter sp.]